MRFAPPDQSTACWNWRTSAARLAKNVAMASGRRDICPRRSAAFSDAVSNGGGTASIPRLPAEQASGPAAAATALASGETAAVPTSSAGDRLLGGAARSSSASPACGSGRLLFCMYPSRAPWISDATECRKEREQVAPKDLLALRGTMPGCATASGLPIGSPAFTEPSALLLVSIGRRLGLVHTHRERIATGLDASPRACLLLYRSAASCQRPS